MSLDFPDPPKPTAPVLPCLNCKGEVYWLRDFGGPPAYLCATCHPPPIHREVVTVQIGDDSAVDC